MNDKTQVPSQTRWKLPLLIVLTAGALVLVAFLGCTTVYSSDDYWYSTFMDHGVAYYFHMMWVHYQTYNGRSLVHFFVHLILHVGNVLFAAFLLGCCIGIPMALCATETGKKTVEGKLLCLLLFTSGVLLLPRIVMVSAVLWISGFCNYFLSTAMVAIELFLLYRAVQRERIGLAEKVLLLLFCFLCGATTEQVGATASGVVLLFVFKCLVQRNKRFWFYLLAEGCSLLGLLTVFLSPATSSRVSREGAKGMAVRGFTGQLKKQIQVQANFFSGSWFLIAVFGVLFLFTAWVLWCGIGAHRIAVIWCVLGVVSLYLLCTGKGLLPWKSYLVVIALTALQTVVWMRAGYEGPAFFLLAGLGTAGIILFTNTGGERTLLPLCLCMIAAASWAGTMLLEKLPGKAIYSGIVIALSVLVCIVVGRQIPGYWHNYVVDQQNQRYEAEAADTGVLYYLMDYDRSYTHVKPYESGDFYHQWLDSIGIDPASCHVYFYREDLPIVYAGDVRMESPAMQGSDGWMLPLSEIVKSLGGSLEFPTSSWSTYIVRLGNREFTFHDKGNNLISIEWTDESGEHQIDVEKYPGYYATCISEDIFAQVLGLDVQHENGEIRVELPVSH